LSDSNVNNDHRVRLQNAAIALKKLQAQVDALESAKREPIAVIGAGCRFPGGANSPAEFWRLLHAGFDAVGELPPGRWDVEPFRDADRHTPGKMTTQYGNYLSDITGFDPQFFGISPREALSLDPQQRLLLEVTWEALEHASQAPDMLAGSRTGVFVGISLDDYAQFHFRSGDYTRIDAYTCSGAGLCYAPGRVSYILGLHGPSLAVDTACSSSLAAIHLACLSLRAGECDMALAGGVNLILTPDITIGMSALRALSSDGRCKAFDASGDGFGRGEGCGMVVLKRLSQAVAARDNIIAVIRASGMNHDGPSSGLMVPNGRAQEALLRDVLARAAIQPADVDYIEAHGTGTELGDPIEMEALAAVFAEGRPADRPLQVGSVKTNVGHLEAAAGVSGLLKVALALQHSEIPPHLHLSRPSPHIPWNRLPVTVPTQPTPWPAAGHKRAAGVSAFGLSGTNVHVLLEEAPPITRADTATDRPLHLLRLSAKTPAALYEMARQLERHIASDHQTPLADICYSANVGRACFPHRMAMLIVNREDARSKLAAFASRQETNDVWSRQVERGERPKVAFLFTGQGSQYVGMGQQLYATQPTFRAALDQCNEVLHPYLEFPLHSVLFGNAGHGGTLGLLDNTAYTQPALFALEYALAQLWRSWGVEPTAVLGHSVGELVAACVAGVFSLEDGLKLIATRAKLMQALPPGGAMAAVLASEPDVALMLKSDAEVSIAAINGPLETVISGAENAVLRMLERFEAAGIKTQRLTVSHAFHSRLIEPMLDEFTHNAAQVRHAPPRVALVSNITGRLFGPSEAGTAYWRRHAREPVRFAAGMETLYGLGIRLFVEVGPKPVLTGLGSRMLPDAAIQWLPSLRKNQDEWHQMLHSLSTLHLHGVRGDWQGFDRDYARQRVPLPTYPFQRTRYWTPRLQPQPAAVTATGPKLHPLVHRRIPLSLREQVFESVLSSSTPEFLSEHVIAGSVLLPATAYLEMVVQAGVEVFGPGRHVIDSIRFDEALVLSEAGQTIQITLTPESSDEMRFEICRSTVESSGGTDWRLLASGRLLRGAADGDASSTNDPVTAIQQRCTEEVPATTFYELFQQQGIEHGPVFRGLVRILRRSGEALGEVQLPATATDEANQYHCHPALLDAALQIVITCMDDFVRGTQTHGYIPVAMERFCLYRKPSGRLWTHATLQPTPDSALAKGDVRLLDEQGDIVAEVAGLHIRRLQQPSARMLRETANMLYEIQWRPQDSPASAAKERRRWLISSDRGGVGLRLSKLLEASGALCTLIDSTDPTQLPKALASAPEGIVYLGALDCALPDAGTGSTVQEAAIAGCTGALRLIQAVAGRTAVTPPRLWLVTRGAQPVGIDASVVAPTQAPLWGLASVIGLEHPAWSCVRVDLDPAENVDPVPALIADLKNDGPEDRIAWRSGKRYVARYTAKNAQLATTTKQPPPIRADGAYVITGGLGALGLRVAAWLIENGARHLLLLGRSAPKPSAMDAIRSLESAGAQVIVEAADVARESDVARVLTAARESMPSLRGVIHTAGVLDDGVLLHQDATRLANAMAPKVAGAWNLHKLTQEDPLDFFVLFSSIVALAGTAGQGNYAAANAFLDALAHHRRSKGLPALSINWGAWAAGMASELSTRDQRRYTDVGVILIPPELGIQTMASLIAQDAAQVSVLPIDWPQFLRQFQDTGEPPFYSELSKRAASARTAVARPSQLLHQLKEARPNRRRHVLAAFVRDEVSSILGLDPSQPLDSDQPLSEVGVDSLMAVEIRNALGRPLSQTLPVTLLYDYPTVNALTDYLAGKLPQFEIAAAAVMSTDAQQQKPATIVEAASEEEAEAMLLRELDALNF
jgi:acyl transferase domain-containing protein/acyl carrier protein